MRESVLFTVGFRLPDDQTLQTFVFDTANYTTKAEWLAAIDAKPHEIFKDKERCIYGEYLDLSPVPHGKFYPTGGVRWPEKAWQYSNWLNTPPPPNTSLKKGDRVRFLNSMGCMLEETIFGFSDAGEAVLSWDCYWITKPCEHLTKVDIFDEIEPINQPVYSEPWANKSNALAIENMQKPKLQKGVTVRVNIPEDNIKTIEDVLGTSMSGELVLDWFFYFYPLTAMNAQANYDQNITPPAPT